MNMAYNMYKAVEQSVRRRHEYTEEEDIERLRSWARRWGVDINRKGESCP